MKYLIISKNNLWTRTLLKSLKNPSVGNLYYSTICDKKLIDEINPDWIFFFPGCIDLIFAMSFVSYHLFDIKAFC